MARATRSFPVPLSPVIKAVEDEFATLCTSALTVVITRLLPNIKDSVLSNLILTFFAICDFTNMVNVAQLKSPRSDV